MAEINKLKSQMNNIFVKQIVYNVIKKSKDNQGTFYRKATFDTNKWKK